MNAYPLAMRERILAVWDDGGLSQDEVADLFGVSARWLRKLLALRRAGAALAPKPHAGGRAPALAGSAADRLRAKVADQPDATLAELRDHVAVPASLPAVARALARLGITRKKSAPSRPSSRPRR